MVFQLNSPLGQAIVDKVRRTHDFGVVSRGIAEHIHGAQLVEVLLPLCEEHGLCLELCDGEDYYTISNADDMVKHMSACDMEWLCICDGSVERTKDNDTTYVSICLIYGNNADHVETGRGEMVADWSACDSHWWDVFNPVLDDFISQTYFTS